MSYHPSIHRCEHIKVNGTQCGSPAIRKNSFCYFHGRWREQHIVFATTAKTVPAIDLPVLEDANSIQVAIMQVLNLLLTGHIEHKTAALPLYGLQTASANLRHTRFDPYPRQVVINPATVGKTQLGEDVWHDSDVNVREEDDSAAETIIRKEPEPLPDNWRDDVRSQIAALVKKRAPDSSPLQGLKNSDPTTCSASDSLAISQSPDTRHSVTATVARSQLGRDRSSQFFPAICHLLRILL